jgi:hypothetical protein
MVPFFVLSVVGGNTKRKDRVVVAYTPPQEALSHNKTTWIVPAAPIFKLPTGWLDAPDARVYIMNGVVQSMP